MSWRQEPILKCNFKNIFTYGFWAIPRPEFAGYLYQEHILQGIYQEIPGDF